MAGYLQFPANVTCQHIRERIDMVTSLSANWHIAHFCLRLHFDKVAFLGAKDNVEGQRLFGGELLAGEGQLERGGMFEVEAVAETGRGSPSVAGDL